MDRAFLGPVAIGGVGGSGTRVVTQILLDLGFYMGYDLNFSYDNLLFTFLLKRPTWFINYARYNKAAVLEGFRLLEKVMIGRFDLKKDEIRFILRAAVEAAQIKTIPQQRYKKNVWLLQRLRKMVQARYINSSTYMGWGWKEPNTHIYLRYLPESFKAPKYIHVLRHGLDMAYSPNKRQLDNWAQVFQIDPSELSEQSPVAALKYWLCANQSAITLGEQLGPRSFLQVNYDKLCASPQTEIEKIISFLELDKERIDINRLCRIPKTPPSTGRYKLCDLDIFDQTDLAAVCNLGFTIET